MNLISQTSWCPEAVTLTIDSVWSLSDQLYKIGDAAPVLSYTFTDFGYTYTSTCSDTTSYTYRATLASGASLPSFISLNSATKTFSWNTATSANNGVYTI